MARFAVTHRLAPEQARRRSVVNRQFAHIRQWLRLAQSTPIWRQFIDNPWQPDEETVSAQEIQVIAEECDPAMIRTAGTISALRFALRAVRAR